MSNLDNWTPERGLYEVDLRNARKLIEEQRAAIAELTAALQHGLDWDDCDMGYTSQDDYNDKYRDLRQTWQERARALLAKHAPAPSQEGGSER